MPVVSLQGASEGMPQPHEVECMPAVKMQMVIWKQIARAFKQNLELGFSRWAIQAVPCLSLADCWGRLHS